MVLRVGVDGHVGGCRDAANCNPARRGATRLRPPHPPDGAMAGGRVYCPLVTPVLAELQGDVAYPASGPDDMACTRWRGRRHACAR